MCISSNWVNDAQDLIAVKKFRDFQNSLIPIVSGVADVMSACLGVEDTAISRYYILTFSGDINLLNTHQNINI